MPTEGFMRVIGKTVFHVVLVKLIIKMEIFTKVSFKMVKDMDKVSIHAYNMIIMEDGAREKWMDTALLPGMMVEDMKVTSQIINLLKMENTLIVMERSSRDSFLMAKNKAKEKYSLMMGQSIMDIGKMI